MGKDVLNYVVGGGARLRAMQSRSERSLTMCRCISKGSSSYADIFTWCLCVVPTTTHWCVEEKPLKTVS